jgi:hypothetical protein
MLLPITPPTATTCSCSVSRLKLSTAAGPDWSSATARLRSRPWPRPFTPPDLLISFTASAIPERVWMPHGAKAPVSDVRTPILIGAAALAELDPP